MKNKLFSGLLITLSIPAVHAAVTGDELNIGTGNVLMSGTKAAAIGTNNDVDYGGVALGSYNYSGENSLTSGSQNIAYDYSFGGGVDVNLGVSTAASIGFGETSKLFGAYASASFGSNNFTNVTPGGAWSSGNVSGLLIAGLYNTSYHSNGHWGFANILLGKDNTLDSSLAGGDSTINASVLLGLQNKTSKTESWVFGKGNIGQTGTVTLGTYASEVANASLIVGTGTGTSTRSNGLVVLKSGVVQIPGSLVIGSEPAITPSYLSSNLYLKKASGTGAVAASDAVVSFGYYSNASAAGSIAIGHLTNATGPSSVAIGNNSYATSGSSTAIGDGSWARGTYNSLAMMGGHTGEGEAGRESAAIGPGATTTGPAALAIGYGATATEFSNAYGLQSRATGWSSSAAGYNSIASAGKSIAYGYGTTAQHEYAAAFGPLALASGYGSTALGMLSKATANRSVALGAYTTAATYSVTALGSFNHSRPGNLDNWLQTDSLLELGNGVDDTHRSNALVVLKNGQTTLTNNFWISSTPEVVPAAADSSAGEALAVEGHTKLKGNATIDGTTTLNGKVVLADAQGDISMGIYGGE